mmetsp:Transcript_23942/g.35147  ORF Transcript_23942/g.35147 Transcript_23942/m.35147 type:complete len:137 (+) Transcript_23942:74-484(+)
MFSSTQLRSAAKRVFNGNQNRSFSFVNADSGQLGTKFFHNTNLLLVGIFPIAFFSSPSSITYPLDLAMGVLIPLHAHIGVNIVISDYVPKAARSACRFGMVGATVLTIAGLTKLNVAGPGITETIKSLWKSPKKDA